jgi:outer membrane receptor protein involved in Fe transport
MYKLTIILFLLSFAGYCQNIQKCSIYGIVSDAETNQPLSNANIFLPENNIGTNSDKNGKYLIKNIPSGSYILKASFIGYQDFQKKIELKKNQNLLLNISLKDTSISAKEVQIIAKKEKGLLNQPQRINLINVKSIETSPVQSINEIIDYVPGANMSSTIGIFSSKAVVTLRGMPANDQSRTLVLLDGVPLNKSDEGSVNWNMINKNNIENIKITKGPGPAKFGSGAMGGVIELTSKKPQKTIEGYANTEYGTYNTMSANINLGGIRKDSLLRSFYWRINGFGRKSDGYITELSRLISASDTILVPTYLKEFNTSAKAGVNFKNNRNIEIQAGFFDDKRGNGVKVFEKLGAYSTHRTLNFIGSYSGGNDLIKWNTRLFSITENYIRQYEYMNEGEYSLYEANSVRQDIGGDEVISFLKFRHHEIQTGISFKLGSVDGSDTYFTSTDSIRNKGKMDNYGLFLQDEYNFYDDKIQINFGLRYDYARFYDGLFVIENPSYSLVFYKNFQNRIMPEKKWDAICPRFFSQFKLSKSNRIYFSAAKGFRAPILDDMTRTGKKKGGFKISNPDLKPENITTFEVGTDIKLTDHLTSCGSIYFSSGKDFMYNVSTGDSVNMGYKIAPLLKMQNISKVEIYGAEIEIKYDLIDNLNIFANYTYTHAQIKEHQILNEKVDSNLTGKYLTDIPDNKVSAGITWKNKIVNTVLLFKYIGKTWINDMNSVDKEIMLTDKYPDYITVNIRVEKTFIKHFIVSFNIENIFDKTYVTSDAQKCPGRLFTGALKYIF